MYAFIELELYLINESPRVIANSVEAEFEVNGPVTGIRCVLRSQVDTGRKYGVGMRSAWRVLRSVAVCLVVILVVGFLLAEGTYVIATESK